MLNAHLLKTIRHGFTVLLNLLLILQLQACAVTVYNWSEIPEENRTYGYSLADRQASYRHYAIRELNDHPQGMTFRTWEQPDKYYSLNSYSSVLYSQVPEIDKMFETGQYWGNFSRMADLFLGTASTVSFILAYDQLASIGQNSVPYSQETPSLLQTKAAIFVLVLLLTSGITFYLDDKEKEAYEKIKSNYNEALRKELELSEEQIQQLMLPQPSPQSAQ